MRTGNRPTCLPGPHGNAILLCPQHPLELAPRLGKDLFAVSDEEHARGVCMANSEGCKDCLACAGGRDDHRRRFPRLADVLDPIEIRVNLHIHTRQGHQLTQGLRIIEIQIGGGDDRIARALAESPAPGVHQGLFQRANAAGADKGHGKVKRPSDRNFGAQGLQHGRALVKDKSGDELRKNGVAAETKP